ncbi:hypothetical protein P154DRAFT_619199 [Amniculicola lignicola CBS 123094]|uniref:Uncharacterized protein n=1 Tax=Amniculicola lignicola CBS 123094 TaxID=1392246 RepID=A0A6A5WJ91_9PLEO|nr:hypothetical protein P154DRAFT_619199 [Amniculicola lignicola CBS 123094]
MRFSIKAVALAAAYFTVATSTVVNYTSVVQETHITTTTVAYANVLQTLLSHVQSFVRRFDSPVGILNRGIIENMDICWQINGCVRTFERIQLCYDTIGGLINPNDNGQSAAYQGCVCNANTQDFVNRDEAQTCSSCFIQGNMDLSTLQFFQRTLFTFCGTKRPSLYLFLTNMLQFLSQAHAPTTFTPLHGPITQITTLKTLFTPASGLNERNGVETSDAVHWAGTMTSLSTPSFPTEYMTQLPRYWPYEAPAPARRPHMTRMHLVFDDWNETAGVVVASLAWYPRPVGKQKSLVEYTPTFTLSEVEEGSAEGGIRSGEFISTSTSTSASTSTENN